MTAMANLAAQKRVPIDLKWKPVLECAALEVFETMAGARLTPFVQPASDPSDESVPVPMSGQTTMVGMAGALCGMTSISCSSDTAIKLASKMAGDEAAKDATIVSDAMGELLQHGRRQLESQNYFSGRPLHALRPHRNQWRQLHNASRRTQRSPPGRPGLQWLPHPGLPDHPILIRKTDFANRWPPGRHVLFWTVLRRC
jgi:hypothetical protein